MWLDRVADLGPILVAIVVPGLTFRYALQQDKQRWQRERRAQLYEDLLTEAHAEHKWFEFDTASDEQRELMAPYYVDLRLPPAERARLGSRGNLFATGDVRVAFNGFVGEAGRASLLRRRGDGDQMVAQMKVGRAFDQLEAAVRAEMGADDKPRGPAWRRRSSN
jgi:hypothetical protein